MTKSVALLGLALFGCTSGSEPKCVDSNVYIYDSSMDGRSEVFNLKMLTMSTQSRGDANVNRSDSEFAGPIVICTTKAFLCLSGSLDISIPRGSTPTSWSFNGLNCKLYDDRKLSDPAIIECSKGRNSPSIKVQYSTSGGILSYRRQNVGDEAVFKARGECGLFAS